MKYINNIFLSLIAAASLSLTACDSSEDALKATAPVNNAFEVPEGATGLEAELRRQFYKDNGFYLLYSDKLEGSTCGEGNESVDFNWNLTGYNDDSYGFEFFETDAEKQEAYDIIKKVLLPHLDSTKYPYSILPVKNMYTLDGDEPDEYLTKLTCFRCTAYSIGALVGLDDDELEGEFAQMVYNILDKEYGASSSAMSDFLDISADYYGEYIVDVFPDWYDDQDMDIVYEAGFTDYVKDSKDPADDEFLTKKKDLRAYWKLVLFTPESDFYNEWGDYPVIVRKYEMMKSIIAEKVGFVF